MLDIKKNPQKALKKFSKSLGYQIAMETFIYNSLAAFTKPGRSIRKSKKLKNIKE